MQLLILLRLSCLSLSHWKLRCLYGPVTAQRPLTRESLSQPRPDRHNLNSGFATCWVEANSVNAEWRKKLPQRGKAAPYPAVLPFLGSNQAAHACITPSSTAPPRNSILAEHRSSCSFLLLSSQPVSPYSVRFNSSSLTKN